MDNQKTFPQLVKAVFKTIGMLLKIIYTGPLGIMFFLVSGYILWQQMIQIYWFARYAVFPTQYILGGLGLAVFAFGFSFLFLRITFNKKLAKIRYRTILITMAVSVALSAVCDLADDDYTQDFDIYPYPPYILDWSVQTVSETVDCDYSQDSIVLRGDFNVAGSGFRVKDCLELVKADSLTDSYKVEILYKGKEAEIYIHNNEWEMEENDIYLHDINIWPQDYDYELTPQDVAYMYKHRINLEYSQPLAVEKIIIYTAYPEKFDTSEIWFNS